MLEVVWIEIFNRFMREVVGPPLQRLPLLLVILQEVIDVGHGWVLRVVAASAHVISVDHDCEYEVDKKLQKL